MKSKRWHWFVLTVAMAFVVLYLATKNIQFLLIGNFLAGMWAGMR